ncbi:AraC family transcriptional regulator [Paenibacillus koleovorans]|uniref:AraC family transcriptional regulator n=1 Tax=Paenibacillus koleovorans TaxID=121608 RepID=UPI000FD9BF39|nr:AraC family transcriptional regulator [Paenibacillus koleovorans]
MKLPITYANDIPIHAFRWTPHRELEPLHCHTSLEIGCCVSGRGFFYFGDKRYPVRPGDVFLVNNEELHIAQSDRLDPSAYIFLNFNPHWLLGEEEALLLPFAYRSDRFENRIPAESPLAAQLAVFIRRLYEELQDKREGYRSMAKSLLLELCVTLLRHYTSGVTDTEWRRRTASIRKLRPALSLLEEKFREPIELKEVAETLGVTPSRASHLLQEELGRGFRDILLQLRLNEAKRLLISTERSVADVCFESGFQSVASFYRLFKTDTGQSPLEYRSAKFSLHAIVENAT